MKIKGGGIVFLRPGLHHFRLVFQKPGRNFLKSRKVEFVVHYTSERDKVGYELEERKLSRKPVVNGKPVDHAQQNANLSAGKEALAVTVTITRDRIVIEGPDGTQLDEYRIEDGDLTSGKVGIRTDSLFVVEPHQ
jgi:hypothetical protein